MFDRRPSLQPAFTRRSSDGLVSGNGCPPVLIESTGGWAGGAVTVRSSLSSQFITGLLLSAPFAEGPTEEPSQTEDRADGPGPVQATSVERRLAHVEQRLGELERLLAERGLSTYIGGIVGNAICKELAPVMMSILIAGRIGSAMAAEISATPWPTKFTAAEPEKSRYRLPSESQTWTPSPRMAAGNNLRNDRRRTAETAEDSEMVGSATPRIIRRGAGRCQKMRKQE